jgi:titin
MSNSQINLSWADNATNETGFKIERKIGAGGTYSQIGTVGAGVTSYQDTGLAASTQYYYRVRASNGVGDSSCSNEANATTQTPTPPAVPSGLGASAVSSSQINLSWTDNATNETGFKIERKTGSGGTYGQIGTVGANVTAYQDTGLAGSTQYYYRVRATNGGGDSVYSNEANATTQTPLPPAAPSALAASAVSTNQINLSWTDNAADETGFKIERKTGAGGTYSQIATVATNVTTYHDIGLAASTQYYYRVLATNSVGDSAYSNEANATTQAPPPPPAAPSGLAASAISSSQINLSWTDNATSETGFKLERKTGAGGTYAQIATFGANVTTYQDGGLAASTEYYYRVQDSGIGGDSAYSNEANATTQDPPPGPVTIFASMVPAVTNCNTANAGGMEVGTRWQSSQAGTLVGLRYYRSGSDTEQHTLKLWDPAVSTNAPQATVSTVGGQRRGLERVEPGHAVCDRGESPVCGDL